MDDKDIYEFYRQAYEFEHKRKDAINSRLSLILTSLVIIIGAVTYFINNLSFTFIGATQIVFFILLIILVIIMGLAFYYLYRCFFSYKYRYIARTKKIYEYQKELEDYQQKSNKSLDIGKKLEDYLKLEFSDASSINRANNRRKNGYFIRALRTSFLASFFVVLIAVPFYIMKMEEPKESVYMEIKNLSEIKEMFFEEQEEGQFDEQTDPKQEPEPTPPKPEDITEADVGDNDEETKTNQDKNA